MFLVVLAVASGGASIGLWQMWRGGRRLGALAWVAFLVGYPIALRWARESTLPFLVEGALAMLAPFWLLCGLVIYAESKESKVSSERQG